MPYMDEPWFAVLRQAAEAHSKRWVALRMGVSPATVGQVMNGSGAYGDGTASTAKVAVLVMHKFGQFECPHLSERFAEPRVISASECRQHAHQPAPPIGSPQALLHWRACSTCPHKALSAPAVAKPPGKPRRKGSASSNTPDAAPGVTAHQPEEVAS